MKINLKDVVKKQDTIKEKYDKKMISVVKKAKATIRRYEKKLEKVKKELEQELDDIPYDFDKKEMNIIRIANKLKNGGVLLLSNKFASVDWIDEDSKYRKIPDVPRHYANEFITINGIRVSKSDIIEDSLQYIYSLMEESNYFTITICADGCAKGYKLSEVVVTEITDIENMCIHGKSITNVIITKEHDTKCVVDTDSSEYAYDVSSDEDSEENSDNEENVNDTLCTIQPIKNVALDTNGIKCLNIEYVKNNVYIESEMFDVHHDYHYAGHPSMSYDIHGVALYDDAVVKLE
jgi:hypothetical protein